MTNTFSPYKAYNRRRKPNAVLRSSNQDSDDREDGSGSFVPNLENLNNAAQKKNDGNDVYIFLKVIYFCFF